VVEDRSGGEASPNSFAFPTTTAGGQTNNPNLSHNNLRGEKEKNQTANRDTARPRKADNHTNEEHQRYNRKKRNLPTTS